MLTQDRPTPTVTDRRLIRIKYRLLGRQVARTPECERKAADIYHLAALAALHPGLPPAQAEGYYAMARRLAKGGRS